MKKKRTLDDVAAALAGEHGKPEDPETPAAADPDQIGAEAQAIRLMRLLREH